MGSRFLKEYDMNTIQINKFSNLHDGVKVFFCKTDFLQSDFEYIKTLNHNVILISGNSDYVIDQNILNNLPLNVKFWFAQNALVEDERVMTLPLGIENYEFSKRPGHGIGYDRVKIKDEFISNKPFRDPTKFAYSNFRVNTNPHHRNSVRSISINTDFIDWQEPNLSVEDFFDTCLDYELIVCAQGNGPGDNHRIYETLYMDRIPLTFNKVMYDRLHHNFPVILIEDIQKLSDLDYLKNEIQKLKGKTFNKEMLDCNWWINLIKSKIELL